MYEIEKGVPIPQAATTAGGRPPKYPLAQMEVGDSFFAPVAHKAITSSISSLKRSGSIAATARFTTRVAEVDGRKGVRTWRVR